MRKAAHVTQFREGKFAPLRTKLLWTALLFLAFMLGRYVPVPYLHGVIGNTPGDNRDLLDAANVATGGNFFHPSLFSLGLGPWMVAAILWRFLLIGKLASERKIPTETVDRARNVVMVLIALFQAISLMSHYPISPVTWGPFDDRVNAEIIIVVFLTAGAVLVAWLAKKNEDLGLGGITMFILYQIIITAWRNADTLSAATHDPHFTRVLWLVIAAIVCVIALGIFAGNAELRLHVNKISIDSGYAGMSYLPVKLNPAGASPIMYALALLALPQYVAHAVATVAPSTEHAMYGFLTTWGLTTPVGFAAYLVLLFCLSIFFGLFTVSPRDIAERMRKGGEYFDHIAPGAATRGYIRRRVVLLSAVTGVILVVLTGLPLYFIGEYPRLQYLLTAPGTVMIALALLWMLQEEVADTMLGTRYEFTFTPKNRASRRAARKAIA